MKLENAGESPWDNEDDAVREPVPEWHQKVLDSRWSDYQAGKVKPISLEELERRLRQG